MWSAADLLLAGGGAPRAREGDVLDMAEIRERRLRRQARRMRAAPDVGDPVVFDRWLGAMRPRSADEEEGMSQIGSRGRWAGGSTPPATPEVRLGGSSLQAVDDGGRPWQARSLRAPPISIAWEPRFVVWNDLRVRPCRMRHMRSQVGCVAHGAGGLTPRCDCGGPTALTHEIRERPGPERVLADRTIVAGTSGVGRTRSLPPWCCVG